MLPLLMLCMATGISAHGGMIWPPIWQDGRGLSIEEVIDAKTLPPITDPVSNITVDHVRCFLSDLTYVGGIGSEFEGVGEATNYNNESCRPKQCRDRMTPWAAPGRAPAAGGGCGVFGGNPYGCPAHNDDRPPGSECRNKGQSGIKTKSIFSKGSRAVDLEFPEAALITKWKQNSVQDVMWVSKGGHGGGYTYRLCAMPAELTTGLTEECFADNVLEFWEPYTMIRVEGEENLGKWTKVAKEDLLFDGNWWRQTHKSEGKKGDRVMSFRKDTVEVPNLPVGLYVLSFRWDTENAPQVWMSCSYILITKQRSE